MGFLIGVLGFWMEKGICHLIGLVENLAKESQSTDPDSRYTLSKGLDLRALR